MLFITVAPVPRTELAHSRCSIGIYGLRDSNLPVTKQSSPFTNPPLRLRL